MIEQPAFTIRIFTTQHWLERPEKFKHSDALSSGGQASFPGRVKMRLKLWMQRSLLHCAWFIPRGGCPPALLWVLSDWGFVFALCRSSCHEDWNSFIGNNNVFSHALALFWRNVESCALSWWETNVHSSTVQPWFVTCANFEDVDDYFNSHIIFVFISMASLVWPSFERRNLKLAKPEHIWCITHPVFVTYSNMHVTSVFYDLHHSYRI